MTQGGSLKPNDSDIHELVVDGNFDIIKVKRNQIANKITIKKFYFIFK